MKNQILSAIAAIALAGSSGAQTLSAQLDPGDRVAFKWGAIHMTPGMAYAVNFTAWNAVLPAPIAVEIILTDKNGLVIYDQMLNVAAGHSAAFVVAPGDARGSMAPDTRTLIPADAYAVIPADYRTVSVAVKVTVPPDPYTPVLDRGTVIMELLDAATGKITSVANHPRVTVDAGQ